MKEMKDYYLKAIQEEILREKMMEHPDQVYIQRLQQVTGDEYGVHIFKYNYKTYYRDEFLSLFPDRKIRPATDLILMTIGGHIIERVNDLYYLEGDGVGYMRYASDMLSFLYNLVKDDLWGLPKKG